MSKKITMKQARKAVRVVNALDALNLTREDMADLVVIREKYIRQLQTAMMDAIGILGALSMGTEGHLRGRICSASNRLNHALGRTISSHGDQPCPECGAFGCAAHDVEKMLANPPKANAALKRLLRETPLWEKERKGKRK